MAKKQPKGRPKVTTEGKHSGGGHSTGKHSAGGHEAEQHPVTRPEKKAPEVKHEEHHEAKPPEAKPHEAKPKEAPKGSAMPHFKEGPEARVGDRCKFLLPSTGGTQPLPLRARGAGEPKLLANDPVLHEGVVLSLSHGETASATVAYATLEYVVLDGVACAVSKLATTDVHLGDCEKI